MDEPLVSPRPVSSPGATAGLGRSERDGPEAPGSSPSRARRLRGPLLTAGLVGGFTLALHFRDPHSAGSWGTCPWLALTGFYCPGCGSLRAVHDLTNGDVVAAAGSNLIFVLMVPLLILWWVSWSRRSWSGSGPSAVVSRHSGLYIALAAAVMVAFGVLRNLPAGSWLAP